MRDQDKHRATRLGFLVGVCIGAGSVYVTLALQAYWMSASMWVVGFVIPGIVIRTWFFSRQQSSIVELTIILIGNMGFYGALGTLVGAFVARRRAVRSTIQGRCLRCGYDLTGNISGKCPECGNPTENSA